MNEGDEISVSTITERDDTIKDIGEQIVSNNKELKSIKSELTDLTPKISNERFEEKVYRMLQENVPGDSPAPSATMVNVYKEGRAKSRKVKLQKDSIRLKGNLDSLKEENKNLKSDRKWLKNNE